MSTTLHLVLSNMFAQNQAPWTQQSGQGNDMQQGPRPGSQPWNQQRQMPPSSMQNNQQFPGFGNTGPNQQPWISNQPTGDVNQGSQSGRPWMPQNQGGPAPQQPQNFPPYYQQHQKQQQQQQPQQPSPQMPQVGQHHFIQHQQGQQPFPSPQQDMPNNNALWGQQNSQSWQQQVSPQQQAQQMPPQQQVPPQQQMQGIPAPKVVLRPVAY